MFDCKPKRVPVYLKAIFLFLFTVFITATYAQNEANLVIKGKTSMKLRAKGLGIGSGITSVKWTEEDVEGVNIEIKKNGTTIAKATSGKKGKYSFQVSVNTADAKNDYVVWFSKEGMAPQTVNINGFLPKEEYAKYPPGKYEVELDLRLITTTVTDVVPEKPFAKVKWDKLKEHKFTVDEMYAKVSMGEELKILANPDQYYTALVKKQKKKEEAALAKQNAADSKLKAAEEAKRKAEEEARLKAEAEAQRLAAIKAKEEADRIEREKAEALRLELLKKHIADSMAEVERKKNQTQTVANANLDIKKTIRTIEEIPGAGKDFYDAAETFSINVARRSLNSEKERRSREKGKNLSAKYETTNVLTSLLNGVDEYDKASKRPQSQ